MTDLLIATDSEWHAPDKSWLATTFSSRSEITGQKKRFCFIDANVSEAAKEIIKEYCTTNDVYLEFCQMTDDLNLLSKVIPLADDSCGHKDIDLLMFYSAKDLEFAFGWNFISEVYKSGGIKQKRNIKTQPAINLEAGGSEYNVNVKDLKGWSGGGLKKLADAVGVVMQAKSDMDEYKTTMRDGLEALPVLFMSYSLSDSDDLIRIYDEFAKLIFWVQHDVVGIPSVDCYLLESLPGTTGAIVAGTLKKWIYSTGDKNLIEFCFRKLGFLKESSKNYKNDLDCFLQIVKNYNSRYDILADLKTSNKNSDLNKFFKARFKSTGLSQGGVNHFARLIDDSAALNAIVQGGRCVNERPTEYTVHFGADIDLESCYGSALRQFIYPIGLPTVWGLRPNQKRISLKQWLSKHESDLEDNLWTVTLCGNLNFSQDLIFSKLTTTESINRAVFGAGWDKKDFTNPDRDDDISHIPGHFGLIRKQIQNGILTSDVLKVIRSVASNSELNQFMNLEVAAALAYLKSDRVDSIDAWIDRVISDKGTFENVEGKSGHSRDTRTRSWVGLPLEGFIGRLVTERGRLKKIAKQEGISTEEKILASAKQEALKLFVNTTYGVLASPYFPVGNTVVANNITARARVGAWMLNKALHTRQSITDGGFYSVLEVPILKPNAKLPGLDLLSDNTRWLDSKNYTRVLKPLGGRDWKPIYAGITEKSHMTHLAAELDSLAMEQINSFWGRYGLELPFEISHKADHTFHKASYVNKAHYHFLPLVGEGIFKIRGARNYTEDNLRRHPTFDLLINLADGLEEFPQVLEYNHKSLLKIGKWTTAQQSNGYENVKGLRPGDELVETRTARYNNTHMFCDTVADFLKRSERKTFVRGEKVQWFERYAERGFSKVHAMMLMDSLQLGKNTKSSKNA
ncbi:hypothetical protein H6G93_09340 [Nostoc sp. FACHB-973]|nr:hypothetical protein [Nostoc sp. FACHB-973]